MSNHKTTHHFPYAKFSQLAGPLKPVTSGPFRVRYRHVASKHDMLKTSALALASIGVEVGFLAWLSVSLLAPLWGDNAQLGAVFVALLVCIFMIEGSRLVSLIAFALSALVAKDPMPMVPEAGTRIAFTTAIVPSKEPFEMVERTLRAMKQVKHDGPIDVWLLDEGNDPAIRGACIKLGVKHFSRKGAATWNTASGSFKARTKHGNYNAWLFSMGRHYDYVLSVDSDHVPHDTFAQRMLGYFRDPDVAFVVGPQVYGNTETVIARGSESQSYVFQATIQRAANVYDAAMFVGTNHAYRVSTMLSIGGFQDSITEDLLTSLTIHSTRNPITKRHWKSVYTPDVLAIGEGPASWSDFFSQQLRWSRGSNEILLKNFWKLFWKLPSRARFHYGLIIWCYPAAALTWTVGITVSMLYLFLGTTGVGLHDKTWLALYLDVIAVQGALYVWLRKYNVSPHEPRGSFGMSGILFSIFAAPIYAYALVCTILRRKSKFVVTAKGDTISPDTWQTFRHHLLWAGLITTFLGYSITIGNTHPNVKIWCSLALATCLTPVIIWQASIWRHTKRRVARLLRLPGKATPVLASEGV